MGGYIATFIVYTLAMLGVIFLAFIITRKSLTGDFSRKKNSFLSIESTLSMGTRKSIHVLKAGGERFLIASDLDKTSFLTKLAIDEMSQPQVNISNEDLEEYKNTGSLRELVKKLRD